MPLHRNRRASTKGWDKIPSHFGRTTKVSCHGCWFLPGAGPRPHHRSLGVRKSAESRQPGTVTSRCDRRSPHRLGYPDAGRRPRLEAAAISPQRGRPSWRLLSRKRIQAYENEEVREFLLKAIWLPHSDKPARKAGGILPLEMQRATICSESKRALFPACRRSAWMKV